MEQENKQNDVEKDVEKDVENHDERVPAPGERENKKKKLRKIGYAGIAVGIAVLSFFAGMGVTWSSIDPELRTLLAIKQKIQKDYYEEVTDEQFYDALFSAVNDKILDDYSGYMSAEEYAEYTKDLSGNRAGLGVVFRTKTDSGEDQLLITRVCGNSPAESAGIKAGEYVVGFGATETALTYSVSYDEFYEFLQDYGAGEKFYLQVENNGSARTLEISREEYVENYVFYRSNTTAYAFGTVDSRLEIAQDNPLASLDDDTAYIRITQFTGNASGAFITAMQIFERENKKNLVLDLRGNGGGYLSAMQTISAYFCKTATSEAPVVAIADYGKKQEIFRARTNLYYDYFQDDSRIVLLADGDSASASECLIGCMLDYGAITYADICLTEDNGVAKTYGKGIMQTTYFVNYIEGNAIKLTTARVLWPISKACIHDRGVVSADGTKTVARSYEGDTELNNALAVLFG